MSGDGSNSITSKFTGTQAATAVAQAPAKNYVLASASFMFADTRSQVSATAKEDLKVITEYSAANPDNVRAKAYVAKIENTASATVTKAPVFKMNSTF